MITWPPKDKEGAGTWPGTPVRKARIEKSHSPASMPGLPPDIASALAPGEPVEAVFEMSSGLKIFATGQRFFGHRDGRVRDVRYAEVSEARRRTNDWRTWRGMARIGIGLVFIAAGVFTGFATPLEAAIALGLIVAGGAFVFLGVYRRDDWVELKIDRKEPPPSFWYIVVFLPFWLMLQSRNRYKVAGDCEQVDAFYEFLTWRLASHQAPGEG